MLDRLFNFEEIRVTSRRPESRERFAGEMSTRLGKPVRVMETAEATVRDADIVIDASRLLQPEVLVASARTSASCSGTRASPSATSCSATWRTRRRSPKALARGCPITAARGICRRP
jgi:ornithine cyclodeaminase